jgi:hypothetical protein
MRIRWNNPFIFFISVTQIYGYIAAAIRKTQAKSGRKNRRHIAAHADQGFCLIAVDAGRPFGFPVRQFLFYGDRPGEPISCGLAEVR